MRLKEKVSVVTGGGSGFGKPLQFYLQKKDPILL